jgi:hypothetical protein
MFMACRSCGSEDQTEFNAEANLHFPGRKGLDQPHVLACPRLIVCLGCGATEFKLQPDELRALHEGAVAH